jgi:hypothetical protein
MEKRRVWDLHAASFLYITSSHSSGYFTAGCSFHPDHPDEGEGELA